MERHPTHPRTRRAASLAGAALALFLLFEAGQASAQAIRVAVEDATNRGGGAATVAQLNNDNRFAAQLVNAGQIDTAAELNAFDVVILGDSGHNDNDHTLQMAQALNTWVNNGGALITAGWFDYSVRADGTDQALDELTPIDAYPDGTNHFCSGNVSVAFNNTAHPITTGITLPPIVSSGCCVETNPLAPDAPNSTILGNAASGGCTSSPQNWLVVADKGAGRVVYTGLLYMASIDTYPTAHATLRTGVLDVLLKRMVIWANQGVNTAPTVTLGGPFSVNEGASLSITATGNDPEGQALTYTWDLDNDGQFDDATGNPATFVGLDGPLAQTIRVQVSDGSLTATATSTVNVTNVAPTITNLTATPPSPNEGTGVALGATATDPAGALDPLTYTWVFGDGTPNGTGAAVAHIYADDGTYNGSVTVTDGDGGSTTRNFTITVGNVPPTLAIIAGPNTVNEGVSGTWTSTLTKLSGDTVSYSWDFGDGTAPNTGTFPLGNTGGNISQAHTYADNGVYTVTLRATDSDNSTVTQTFSVTVRNVNPAITAAAVNPMMGNEGATFAFTSAATDVPADSLTYAWSFGDGTPDATGQNLSHVYTNEGTYEAVLTVTDDDGGASTRTITVIVRNVAPVITALAGDLSGFEGDTFSYASMAIDPGMDVLTYTWDFGDGTPNATGVNLANVSHIYTDDGTYTLRLTVSDGVASATRTLTVEVDNVPAVLTDAVIPTPVDEGASVTFSATAFDPGDDALTFVWSFGDGTPAVEGREVTHTFVDNGAFFVSVTVADGDSEGIDDEIEVGVIVNNVAPTVTDLTGDFAGAEGATFDFEASATDPAGRNDTLTYTWNWGDASAPTVGVDRTSVSHVYVARGTYTLSLTVADEDGGQVIVQRTINVGGQGPAITALDGTQAGNEGGTFAFTAAATEPGNDAITYTWSFGDGTPNAVAVDLTAVSHVYAEDGVYTVTLTVRDPDGSATATLTVNVANVAPSITNVVVPMTSREGEPVAVAALANDPAGMNDPLTYTWSWGDGSPNTQSQTANHTYLNEGTYTVTLTVSDDDGGSASVTRTIEVSNVAPVITQLVGPNAANEGQLLSFSAAATERGSDTIIYTWDFGDGSAPITGETATSVEHTYADNGAFTVTLNVSDGVATTTRTLRVNVRNVAPTIATLTGDTTGTENGTFRYTGSATDPAGINDPLTYAWSFGDGATESGRDLTSVEHVYTDAGLYSLTLTVTDGDGGTATRTLVVRVGNGAPVIATFEGDQTSNEGSAASFRASATDVGNDALTYTYVWGDNTPNSSGLNLTSATHVYADNGTYTVTLLVTDGTDTARQTRQITVNNVAPTITDAVVPMTGNEGVAISVTSTATDPAGAADPLAYVWSWGDNTPNNNTANAAHTYTDNGTFTVTLTVNDGDNGVTTRTFTVTIGNVAPVVTAINGPASVTEAASASFTAVATDVPNDPLTYMWSWGDGTPNSMGVTAAHTYADNGTFTVTVTANDGDGGSTTFTREVVVDNVNPVIASLTGDFNGQEGDSFDFSATASDVAGMNDPLTYTWDFGVGGGGGGGNNEGVFTGVDLRQASYVYTVAGVYTLTLLVTDGDGGSATIQRSVNVGTAAPSITATTIPANGNEAQRLSFTASATDPTNQALTYTWSWGDGTPDTTGASAEHTFADNGAYLVRVTVTDTDGLAATSSAQVVVANLPPTINTFTVGMFGENVAGMVSSSASDPAGAADPLAYRWSWGDGTADTLTANASHTFRQQGTYTVTLTVTDGDGGMATRTQTVTIEDTAPVLVELLGPSEGDEGSDLSYEIVATDAASDPLTYAVALDGGEPVSLGDDRTFTFTPPEDGLYTLTVFVTDDAGQTDALDFEVTVLNVAPEVVEVTGNTEGNEGDTFTYVVNATDPGAENDPLTYTWDFGDGSPSFTGLGADAVEHVYAADGVYTVTLTVADDDEGSTTVTFEVTVNNAAPVISALNGPDAVLEGSAAEFVVVASDAGGDELTYAWTYQGGPSPSGVGLSRTSHTYGDDGSFLITVTVTDADGDSATLSRTLTVNNANPLITGILGIYAGEEGDTLDFDAQASDPAGANDTLTYAWSWGDGTPNTSGALNTASHTYNDMGVFTLTLTVTDEDGGRATATRTVNIGTAAPTLVTFEPSQTGVEAEALGFSAQATDPTGQILTYTWEFGDGTDPAVGADLTELTHIYADDGTYVLTLTVTDEDGLISQATAAVVITNAPPTIDAFNVGAFAENASGSVSALASDPAGAADPLTYTWSWGDGTQDSVGSTATHIYTNGGTYTLTLTVTDGDGGVATRTQTVTIGDEAPVIQEVVGPREVNEGDMASFEVSAFDVGGDDLSFTWQVNGEAPVSTGTNTVFSRAFADNGEYTFTVTATDEQGQTTTTTFTVTVSNVSPTIAELGGVFEGDEGATLNFFATATDPAGDNDPLDYAWTYGDGSDPETGAGLTARTHTYADDGTFELLLTVSDDDNGTTSETREVVIRNVAPTITSDPQDYALLDTPYTYTIEATDPGADELTYELVEGPEGMTLEGNVLSWTVTEAQFDQGPFTVTVRVSDGDGGTTEQTWELRTDFEDADNDGVPDDCERTYGLDPTDPSDGDEDADGDGISNRDECLDGTDPSVSNAPSAPEILSPAQEEQVDSLTPELVVTNSTDIDGDTLVYTFELYSDEALTALVTSTTEQAEGQDGTTAWTVDVELAENSRYFWRARANDGALDGPWSERGLFYVNAENSPPTVPNPLLPNGSADTLEPVATVDPSADPDGDPITYLFQVATTDDFAEPVAEGESDTTSWTVSPALGGDGQYWWRAAARDDQGAQSDWSGALLFKINLDNKLPSAPVIVNPVDGSTVNVTTVALTWNQSTDEDGDTLTYEVQVSDKADFSTTFFNAGSVPAGGEDTVEVQLANLTEDTTFYARVRANDGQGFGEYGTVEFTVNAANTVATAPVLVSPIDGATVEGEVEFVFTNATDPDGDALSYRLEVATDEQFTNTIATLSDIPEGEGEQTTVKVTASSSEEEGEAILTVGGKLYWRVTAVDARGLDGLSSSTEDFEVIVKIGGQVAGGSGCGCATPNAPARLPWAPMLALGAVIGLVLVRRRR